MAQYDINLREYWRILKKRRYVVIFTAVILGVFSTVFAVLRAPAPIYTSTCTIKFERETTFEGLFARTLTWSGGDDIQTQISIIKSYPVFEKVAERLDLIPKTTTPSPVPSRGALISIIDGLLSKVEVTREEQTNILKITAKDKDPAFAQKLANTVAATYKDLHSQDQTKRTTEAIKYIEDQLVQVRQKLKEAEEEFNRFTQSNQLLAVDLQSEKILGRTQEIQNDISRISETKGEFQRMVQRLDQFIAHPSRSLSDFHLSAADGQYQSANSALTELQLKRDTLLKNFTPLHPEVVEANSKIMENVRKMRILLQAQIAELDRKEADARNDLQEMDKKRNAFMEKKVEYDRLKRKVGLYNDMTTLLEHKNQEAQIKKAEKPEEISIVKPGLFPEGPINPPKTVPTGVMGLLIGLVVGMIAAFIVETFDTSLGAIEDVEETLNTPVWGVIPQSEMRDLQDLVKEHSPGGLTPFSSPQVITLVSHFAPKSMIAESFRALRTNVQGRGEEGNVKAIAITSASPQEGKTLVSVNLGIAMAQAGLKTLLVGSDMRKPVLGRAFGVDLSPGLSDILLGNMKWTEARKTITDILVGKMSAEEVLITPGLDNLHFITAGAIPPNPAELIESKRLRDFISEAKEQYDFIIFDSPPVLSTADAAILGSKVDGVLFVYRVGAVSRGLLKRSATQLEQAKNHLLGVVLNGAKPDISPDFQDLKYYKYYSSYGEKEKTDDRYKGLPIVEKVSVRHAEASGRSLSGALLVLLALAMVSAGALWYQGVIDPLGLAGVSKPPVQEPVRKVIRKALPQGKAKRPSANQITPGSRNGPTGTQATAKPSSRTEPLKSSIQASTVASLNRGTAEATKTEIKKEPRTKPLPAPTIASLNRGAAEATKTEIKKEPQTKPLPAPTEKVASKQELSRGQELQIKKERTVEPFPTSFPYSLYLGSVKTIGQAKEAVAGYQEKGLSSYWVKVKFRNKGDWYRIFVGQFGDREKAQALASDRGLQEAEVFRTEYANLIGVYSQKSVLEGNMRKLFDHGCSPYTVTDRDGKIRLFVGAYVTREAAEEYGNQLKSEGVDSAVVKR